MSAVLDAALAESVISGEVRALASAGEPLRLFEGLVTLLAEVVNYRWLALLPTRSYEPLFAHAHPSARDAAEAGARSILGLAATRPVHVLVDERATAGDAGPPPQALAIHFADRQVGQLVVAPTPRGLSSEDQRTLALVASELGGPLQMSALYQDAQRLATTDGLTGLLNRRAFLDIIERERARADRHAFPMSLMLLDIDHFKAVNDRRGHAAGDAVLQGVSKVLVTVARKSDCVARWGGEEFVIALTQTGDAGARVAAERVRRAVAEATHAVPAGEPLRVTASIGVSSAEAPWQIEALVAAADTAMYTAKQRGRNRVESLAAAELPTAVRRMRAATLTDST
jgi:diguanylate cyclase (GGDEF)-like protein